MSTNTEQLLPTADSLGVRYLGLKAAKRQIEAEWRVSLDAQIDQLQAEFDDLVHRTYASGTTISDIAREIGASRSTVYQILDRVDAGHRSQTAVTVN
ncbi:helix-turn-helix domain-containing protein [Diaminobutyricimonas sp. TR449]|uniref:helix-turn-helix domain-containing protein n=1 Tax=Diaminobutyricimonas sp. TR449 TaxID=2708076 RepID=UPI00141DCEB4|nr:helix-turn-helix domain-containing protein [Diaminobutyricimonas sp. TR449]